MKCLCKCFPQGGFGDFLVSTFVEGTGWFKFDANEFDQGRKNNELFLPGEKGLQNLK